MTYRAKILCIEDDPGTVELLVEVLQEEGFDPRIARNGLEGLERIRERPDLILCDIDMPVLSGFDVLKTLRRSSADLRRIPFLFITAFGTRENHMQAHRLGCDDYILKPLDFELLVEAIRNRLGQARRPDGEPGFHLTDRETEALTWAARGKSSGDIAVLMDVSERTVNFHIDNVMRKVGVATRVQAAVKCSLLGLIDP